MIGYLIWVGLVLITLFVCWVIVKSELDDANQMNHNEIKNKNDEGY